MSALDNVARWQTDPAGFIEAVLVDPETGEPFVLTRAERRFLRHAFKLTRDGRLRYPELVFSGPKKSGKTTFAAMIQIYVVLVLGGRYAEGTCVANDFEQAQGRTFQAIRRIVESSPLLAPPIATITAAKVEFPATGATITAIASDYAGAAGGNANVASFDELWGYVSERSQRLWDELVPPPTRRIACRLTTSYSGFEGESNLLEDLYKRGKAGRPIGPDLYVADGLLAFWTEKPTAPWQTPAWLAQMRQQLRPNAYLRLILNQWVSSESGFVEMDWWDACVDRGARPAVKDKELAVWVGLDTSTKRDATALVAMTFDREAQKVRLVRHRIFQPSPTDPLDFEATIEETLLDWRDRFDVQQVRFDPFQMAATAQRMMREGLPMVEFPQTVANLTAASSNLYELIKGRGLAVYPDEDVRLAVSRAVAIETTRGWRIAKEKGGHKIDVVVALAFAALGAVQKGGTEREIRARIWGGPAKDPGQRLSVGRGLTPYTGGGFDDWARGG